MPLKNCKVGDKPGKKWGDSGKCYTYTPNDEQSRKNAIKKALKQGYAENPEHFKEVMKSDSDVDIDMLYAALKDECGILGAGLVLNEIKEGK